jgi:pyruvate ferredoxin oxidoreductase gamma subunit
MYRIRFHGRGGQGIKTASRILGTALFLEGFEVQDAPRYGAERRGAPIFAYVRADDDPIKERGVIHRPDLVVVADETLLTISPFVVLEGVTVDSVVLICSSRSRSRWENKLSCPGKIVILDTSSIRGDGVPAGALCAGAAAALLGKVSSKTLAMAVEEELGDHDPDLVKTNIEAILGAFEAMKCRYGSVRAGEAAAVAETPPPEWVNVPLDAVDIGAPVIHAGLTSRLVKTGLWRTRRPVIDAEKCRRCLQCCTWCPEGGIVAAEDGLPVIDYDHCKGCLVCAAKCPFGAIRVIPEEQAGEEKDA